MWDMVQNIYKKVSVNLNFVENNNLITESTEAAVHSKFSGINSKGNIRGRVLLC